MGIGAQLIELLLPQCCEYDKSLGSGGVMMHGSVDGDTLVTYQVCVTNNLSLVLYQLT